MARRTLTVAYVRRAAPVSRCNRRQVPVWRNNGRQSLHVPPPGNPATMPKARTQAAVIGGSFMRLAMTLSGATPGCYVEVWLTVRSND